MDDFEGAQSNSRDVRAAQVGSIKSRTEISQQGDVYRASFEPGIESVSMAVISTVAAVSDIPARELPPLYTVFDPDALEALFQPGTAVDISFIYHGHTVTVHSDGGIEVSEYDE